MWWFFIHHLPCSMVASIRTDRFWNHNIRNTRDDRINDTRQEIYIKMKINKDLCENEVTTMLGPHPSGSVELEEPREDVDVDDDEDGHDEHPRLQVVPRPHERVAHCIR